MTVADLYGIAGRVVRRGPVAGRPRQIPRRSPRATRTRRDAAVSMGRGETNYNIKQPGPAIIIGGRNHRPVVSTRERCTHIGPSMCACLCVDAREHTYVMAFFG